MKRLFLFLILAVAVNSLTAGEPPATYLGLKAECRNMTQDDKQLVFIKKQVIVGVATGAAIFAMNEYFIWTQNEAFHNLMPYIAMAYTMYQTVNILVSKSLGEKWGVSCKDGSLTFYL